MIKLAVFDFDGVFTDGRVYFDGNGQIMKYYNAKDGLRFKLLKKAGIKVGVCSGYKENVSQRAILEHLGIDLISLGSNQKVQIVKDWCTKLGIDMKQVAFIGDDINDLDLLRTVGFSGCPRDADKACIECVDFITESDGGKGCIKEFCEKILELSE